MRRRQIVVLFLLASQTVLLCRYAALPDIHRGEDLGARHL
jgi:hypothetical protein